MFWQLLGFFENSQRRQLWIPSPSLPLATTRALGRTGCPQAPRLPDWPLPSVAVLETPAAPAVPPHRAFVTGRGADLQPAAGA